MTTDKQKLIDAGWQNIAQDVTDNKWYGIKYVTGSACGYWFGKDLLGEALHDWHPVSDGQELVDRIEAIKRRTKPFELAGWL